MSLVSAVLQSTENALVYHFNPLLFMLFIVKKFKILPKQNKHGLISESITLN